MSRTSVERAREALSARTKPANRYSAIIEKIFNRHYSAGLTEFEFEREELRTTAAELNVRAPDNLGDIPYTFRYRRPFPSAILATEPEGMEWIIKGKGRAKYQFKLVKLNRIVPREELVTIKIPDATPEIITTYALGDEQALLAKVRYNRLIDIFLGLTTYSLQNHLRTTVEDIGQIEIDEIYVGVDRHGRQFVVPVQAKGGNDKHGVVQTQQDIACCRQKFSTLICRPISAQFMSNGRIAMFELAVEDDEVKVVDERHYQLVPGSNISHEELQIYAARGE
ncbi:MAG: hypothetical protein ACN6PM_05310 [Achromobacter mucicolens]|uniref:hypothetical protein n=1 Tax=Achromobacter mucicolens TaxID=1389922 RepID=UPI003D0E1832